MCNQLDYQSERHCSKTRRKPARAKKGLDYQSERHCSKTDWQAVHVEARWITSQNDTAPKL